MLTNSTFEFHHFPIETASSGLWNGPPTPSNQATKTVYDTVILENSYLKVTLLPDYGGRILSIIHKPTGRELLYQNPMGTPYLMGEGIFYYDYLVILGGIFPSFPEPEHGKYWNQPYELQIVSESPEAVTVRMSRQDDLEWVNGVPEPYDAGRTDLLVELDVTLRAGRSSVELATKLTNTRATPLDNFEYWTVTTLAPGSEPGDTKISDNTKIVAKMDQVHLLESSWSWFGAAEERVSGEIFKWNNLSSFENWDDQGTAFAYPSYEANFSGLINQDSDTGILRVTEGEGTEGLKLWTFGMQSLSIDWTDSSEWLRPTIEMWHGVTPEFWDRETMAAGEVRTWRDHYFPTLGMRDVTASSEFGAVHLEGSVAAETYSLHVVATLAVPNQTVHVVLRLGDTVAHEEDVTVPAGSPLELSPGIPSSQVPAGAVYSVEFLLGGTSILTGQIHLP